ncbi:DUF6752 domain-containing protein [Nocardioides mesophilus]|uniref:DUF6752 domain-containing protein n=1 Tax=Nocardioides mesophilus TaxID=433659 RepID=UPI001FE7B092|nr:DUF6752 domain-containing protein [Nocardioides mesophilus]
MTERVYLHVGAPKSGTTYLQRVLEANRDTLTAAGVLVAGETHLQLVHAGMVVREDPRLDDLPPRARQSWARLVEQVRGWHGPVAVVSYELFAGASADQVATALADLAGLEVHVVITARDFAQALPSAWQERLKFALTTTLEDWSPRPEEDGPRAEWGWRTMDPAGVAARWGRDLSAEHVHVVTVPRAADGPDELWHRFAAACRLDVPGLDLRVERANESLGLVAAELLRRVNEQVTAPITGNREQARWLRDTLAHGVLAGLDREPIGLTDAQFEDAVVRSEACIDTLRSSSYDLRGDLEDLRAVRPEGRTPREVADAEVAALAARALVGLLVLMRERTVEGEGSAPDAPAAAVPPSTARGRVKGIAKTLLQGSGARVLSRENQRLQDRVAVLEQTLQERRRTQLRVAELTDLVTELLLPVSGRDEAAMRSALEEYRKVSSS